MFLESMGRFFFGKIRMPFFCFFCAIIPLCALTYIYFQQQAVSLLEEQCNLVKVKAKTAVLRKERREKFLAIHTTSSPFFLDEQIESLTFLKKEKSRLENWASHPALSNKGLISKRIKFLESGENRMEFMEEEVRISKLHKETIEKQKNPVEMDGDDLKKILSLIEGFPAIQMQRPQLIVTDFTMRKKVTPLQNEVVEINLDLLKREFQ